MVVTDVKKTRIHECTRDPAIGKKSTEVKLLMGLMNAVRSRFDSLTNIFREFTSSLTGTERVLLGELKVNCELREAN